MQSLPKEIKIGKKLQIVRCFNENEYLPSQVLDIKNKSLLIISGPIKKGNILSIHRDEEIKLYYTVQDQGIYYFSARVLSRELSPVYTLKVEKTSKIYKIQKREYFRLQVGLMLDKEHEIVGEDVDTIIYNEKCEIKDISGGGMRINCNYQHDLEDIINCNFRINDHIVTTKAIVERIEKIDTFDYKYSIGVSFKNLEDFHREAIIAYIFQKQRILRNKGLI